MSRHVAMIIPQTYAPMNTRERACVGKDRYGTATHVLRVAQRNSERTGHNVNAYRCDFCGCFHLTSSRGLGHPRRRP